MSCRRGNVRQSQTNGVEDACDYHSSLVDLKPRSMVELPYSNYEYRIKKQSKVKKIGRAGRLEESRSQGILKNRGPRALRGLRGIEEYALESDPPLSSHQHL